MEKLQKRNNKTIDKSFANDKQDAKEFNKIQNAHAEMQKRGKKILIQKYCTVRIKTVLKIVEFKWLFVEYPNALKICMVLVTLNICLHAALAPHYYPSNIFKIEISCFIGLYTNASTNGHTEKLNSIKKYEQMCVCMQIVEIKAYVSF